MFWQSTRDNDVFFKYIYQGLQVTLIYMEITKLMFHHTHICKGIAERTKIKFKKIHNQAL